MGLSQDIPSRLCRLLFTLALLLAWCRGPSLMAQTAADAGATAREPTAKDFKALADRIERLFDAVDQADRALPRDSFDVAAVVASVGKDPQKLFEWVRDQTKWVPYRGALRGASGVLQDRTGNSLDRALLLAELLRAAGHPVRLAQARLTDAQAADLSRKLSTAAAAAAANPAAEKANDTSWDRALDEQARREGADPVQFRRDVEKLIAPVAKLSEELSERVAAQVPALMEALGDAAAGARATGKPDAGKDEAARLDALRDHWWVQRQDAGKWVDLDPTLPDAKPTDAVWPAARTLPLKDPGQLPVDAALCHEVTFRVVVEQWKDGKLTQAPVLAHALRPAEVVGKRVVFTHAPMDWPADLDLSAEADPLAKLRDLLVKQKGWVPMLTVDGKQVMQAAFMSNGSIDPKPNFDAIANAGKAVSGAAAKAATLLDKLDEDPGAGASAAKPGDDAGVLTAEFIDYEIRVPGSPPRTERRPVFDLVGPAARASASNPGGAAAAPGVGALAEPKVGEREFLVRALALGGTGEIVVSGARPSYESVQHLLNQNLLASRDALLKMVRAAAAGDEKAALRSGESLEPMPAEPYLFAVARWVWGRNAGRAYVDRPNVWAYHRALAAPDAGSGPGAAANGAALVRRTVFDIVANDIAVGAASGPEAFGVRVEQGVLDTNLESMIVRGPAAVRQNAGDLFARSAAQGVRWVALRGEADAAWASVSVPPDVKALARQDARVGFLAVAPTKAVEAPGGPAAGWWRIDPATGQTLGMTEAGGASMVEYANHLSFAILVGGFTFYGCGGAAAGASTFKRVGCAICAILAGVIAYYAIAGAAAQAAGTAVPGLAQTMSGPSGVGGAGALGMACNALSGGAS
jgi:hypothetical protein